MLEKVASAAKRRLVIGTHAVIQEQSAASRRLALAVIDEQHRFGVAQRLALREKARGAVDAVRRHISRVGTAPAHDDRHAHTAHAWR
jgi:ATP-dependent DNA helicase RecG